MSLFNFLKNELTRDYWLENDREKFKERRKRVYSFMKIPRELEKFVSFGLLQCFDALLFVFTFLPIRFIKTFFKFIYNIFIKRQTRSPDGSSIWNSAEICDFLKVLTLVASFYLLHHVDFSMMYHVIRGQTVIKLYLFFNMLDVADRLCSSFGQDILDSLFWTATGPRRRDQVGVIPHLALAVFYVFLHTILVLLQANTLNVAFNSHNKALLTIMISNNFLELKSSVFKRFEKSNLFQMTCSDVRERCHLTILLSIVVIRNLNQFSWHIDHIWVLLPDIMLVMVCELMVDWIKHAFITKFNAISFDVYREYSLSLACDIVASRNSRAVSDHLDVVSRRMGFIPLPLAVLLSKVLLQSANITTVFHVILVAIFFLCLLTTKIFLGILLLGYAQIIVMQTKAEQETLNTVQLVTSKDDIELCKTQQDENQSFKRSRSVGHFMREDIVSAVNKRVCFQDVRNGPSSSKDDDDESDYEGLLEKEDKKKVTTKKDNRSPIDINDHINIKPVLIENHLINVGDNMFSKEITIDDKQNNYSNKLDIPDQINVNCENFKETTKKSRKLIVNINSFL